MCLPHSQTSLTHENAWHTPPRALLMLGLCLFVTFPRSAAAQLPTPPQATAAPQATPSPTPMAPLTLPFQFGGLFQVWATNDSFDSAGQGGMNYRVRRSEIRFHGKVQDDVRWFVMIDPAKSLRTGAISNSNDNKVLQDLGTGWKFGDFEVLFAQMKLPSTLETAQSSAQIPMPERTVAARNYGEKRSTGLALQYKVDRFKWTAMSANGTTGNTADTNNEKDLASRIEYSPATGLEFGLYGNWTDGRSRSSHGGISLQWSTEPWATPIIWRAEWIRGTQDGATTLTENQGAWTDLSARLADQWELTARYQSYQANLRSGPIGFENSLGISYLHKKHEAKIQLLLSDYHNLLASSNRGTLDPNNNENAGFLAILAAQASL